MKFQVVLAVAVACASAADDANAPVIRSEYDLDPYGAFQYTYETGNGISGEAHGVVHKANSEYPFLAVKGGFRYTGPDGQPIELTYTADENGYHPQGSHLPVPPPTPEAIARSLAYNAAHPAAEAVRGVPAAVVRQLG